MATASNVGYAATTVVPNRERRTAHQSISHVRSIPVRKRLVLAFRGWRDAKQGILMPLQDGTYQTPALRNLAAKTLEDISLNWNEASEYVSNHVEPRLRHLESVYLDEKRLAMEILASRDRAGEEAYQRHFPGDDGEDPSLVSSRKQARSARARAAVEQKAKPHLERAGAALREALESGLLAEYEDRVRTSEGKTEILLERYHELASIYLEAGRVAYEHGACDIPEDQVLLPQRVFEEHFPPYKFDTKGANHG